MTKRTDYDEIFVNGKLVSSVAVEREIPVSSPTIESLQGKIDELQGKINTLTSRLDSLSKE